MSEASPPHDLFVPHGEDVLVECDVGYVIFNTTDNSQRFTCDRSAPNMPDGAFGPNWQMTMRCVGEYHLLIYKFRK